MRSAREVKEAVETMLLAKPTLTEEFLNKTNEVSMTLVFGPRMRKDKNFSYENLFYLTVWFCTGGGYTVNLTKDDWAFQILDKLIEEEEKKHG